MGLIGLSLLGFAENNGVRYFGVFLATMACNANVPCILTYQANNIRGQWKRALASATLVGAGGIGGIVVSVLTAARGGGRCADQVLGRAPRFSETRTNLRTDQACTAALSPRA